MVISLDEIVSALELAQGPAGETCRHVAAALRPLLLGEGRGVSAAPRAAADRILRYPELRSECGITYSRMHIDRLEKDGRFPRRFPLGKNSVGWVENEVRAWLDAKIADREAPTPQSIRGKPRSVETGIGGGLSDPSRPRIVDANGGFGGGLHDGGPRIVDANGFGGGLRDGGPTKVGT